MCTKEHRPEAAETSPFDKSMSENCLVLGPVGGPLAAKPYEFIGFGAMDVTKPYKFIWFGAMDVTFDESMSENCLVLGPVGGPATGGRKTQ